MARLSIIPPALHQEILDMSAQGKSCKAIAEVFNAKYDMDLDDNKVWVVQRKLLKERQSIAQNVLTEKIEQSAGRDLKIMNSIVEGLYEQYNLAVSQGKIELSLKISDRLNAWHTKSMELTGINSTSQNQPDDEDQLREDILNKLHILTKQDN